MCVFDVEAMSNYFMTLREGQIQCKMKTNSTAAHTMAMHGALNIGARCLRVT